MRCNLNMNNYQALVSAIKQTDPTTKKNNFNKLITIRINHVTKGELILIKKQLRLSSYSKIVRYTIRELNNSFPVLTYRQILKNEVEPQSTDTEIRFLVNKDLEHTLNLRIKQLHTTQQNLVNLILKVFIDHYKKARKYYINQHS